MDRRIVLAALAAVAAGPAIAQTSGAASTAGGTTTGSARSGSSMSQADMQHLQQTMMLGMVALETSKVALEKARNEDLKQFAKFETDEQTTLSEVMRSIMDPSATAAAGAVNPGPSTSAAAPTGGMTMQMDAKGREMVQKLNQASGSEFDREYLQGQMQGHRDLLQVQERYLQSNPQDREHMNVAKMARGMIREHIALLEDIQKKMR
jgi:putative membrane protein